MKKDSRDSSPIYRNLFHETHALLNRAVQRQAKYVNSNSKSVTNLRAIFRPMREPRPAPLTGARLAGDEDGAAGDLALLYHLQDESGGAAGHLLAHHALRAGPRLQRIVQAQAADVRVGADPLQPRDLAHLGHLLRGRLTVETESGDSHIRGDEG